MVITLNTIHCFQFSRQITHTWSTSKIPTNPDFFQELLTVFPIMHLVLKPMQESTAASESTSTEAGKICYLFPYGFLLWCCRLVLATLEEDWCTGVTVKSLEDSDICFSLFSIALIFKLILGKKDTTGNLFRKIFILLQPAECNTFDMYNLKTTPRQLAAGHETSTVLITICYESLELGLHLCTVSNNTQRK